MRKLKLGFAILLTAVGITASAQQGIQFTQYAFTGLTVNPAYAGYKDAWNLNMVSRLQWTGIQGAPRTGAISFDGILDGDTKNMGLGFVATGDMLGPQTTTSLYANYSYRLRLNEEDSQRLCFGLGFGATQYNVDYNKFAPADQLDPNLTGVSKLTPDFRFGIYYYSPSFYVGASALNLLADAGFKDASVVRESRSYYLSAGYMLPLSYMIDFKPTVLFKEDFKGPTNVDLSLNFLINKMFWLGGTYRTGVSSFNKAGLQKSLDKADAIAGIAEFYVSANFRLGYSYDYSMNKLATGQNGTHELSLGLTFGRRRERVINPRYF